MNKIFSCVASNEMLVMLNVSPFGDFSPGKGLCQGDPLSPYLFILCSELLSRLFESECHDNRFKGFKIGRSGLEL